MHRSSVLLLVARVFLGGFIMLLLVARVFLGGFIMLLLVARVFLGGFRMLLMFVARVFWVVTRVFCWLFKNVVGCC